MALTPAPSTAGGTSRAFQARDVRFTLGDRPLIMGILNVTPDSFSDGGTSSDASAALQHALEMIGDGADILDVGGESTRPGFVAVSAEEELARVLPALRAIREQSKIAVSIDTTKAVVARKALEAGAQIVNDVWGFQKDPDMARITADAGAGVVLMHNRDRADAAIDIMADVLAFLQRSVEIALTAGVPPAGISLDPGIGFGKTADQNVEVIRRLPELAWLGFPILLGASRKAFIGRLSGVEDPAKRVNGTLAAHIAGVLGGANIIRVHDVAAHRQAFSVLAAIQRKTS